MTIKELREVIKNLSDDVEIELLTVYNPEGEGLTASQCSDIYFIEKDNTLSIIPEIISLPDEDISVMPPDELINRMSYAQKDNVYRRVWMEHVIEDIKELLSRNEIHIEKGLNEDQLDALVNDAATRYVYDGEYDCNLCYWDNLKNLIESRK